MSIVNKAAMTQEVSKPVNGRSRFPLNQRIAGGYRFGLYQPCYCEDYNPDETIPVKSSHDIRSMNLKSPMLGNVSIHKDFFDVPFTVLLPFNYEKLFVQPSVGEDIDASEVGLNVRELPSKLKAIFDYSLSELAGLIDDISTALDEEDEYSYSDLDKIWVIYVKMIHFLSMTFSAGSLFSSLGLDLNGLVGSCSLDTGADKTTYKCLDLFIDGLWTTFAKACSDFISGLSLDYMTIDLGENEFIKFNPSAPDDDPNIINLRKFIERTYDLDSFSMFPSDLYDTSSDESLFSWVKPGYISVTFAESGRLAKDLNISKLLAYQVVCSEFYTNSRVDYMYSAQLFRQFVSSFLFDDSDGFGLTRETFSWNGVEYQYDYLSAHNINAALDAHVLAPSTDAFISYFSFWRLLFGYNRSLRYVDYFTGGRPRPYPVLGVSVPVKSGAVNVVDTITQTWMARFWNQAYRVGRKLSEYTRGLFKDVDIKRDYHDPMWLGSISDMVDTPETSNTGAAQNSQANSVSSNFVANSTRYAFEYETPQFYGVVIGIIHFDIARYYPHVIERNNFNIDRNDYFNPYLQFVGDQPIYQDELFSGSAHDTFAYTGRDMQYKTKVDRCFGIFSLGDYLPGWLYVAPDNEALRGNLVQNPSYIRAWSSELDKFFTSLSGYSPATYYHFLIVNTNDSNVSRPMIANPQLD